MGPLRFFLALSVMFSHIGTIKWIPVVSAGFAVHAFFIMSGFYICLGLNERYKTSVENKEFYVGRILRLWPIYLLSILILFPSGVLTQTLHRILDLPLPMMLLAFFSNVFIVGIDLLTHMSSTPDGSIRFSEYGIDPTHNGVSAILNLPAWSLSIEILFYLIAPFILRSFKRSVIFFLIGVVYFFCIKKYGHFLPPLRTDLYFPGPSFYFGLGAIGYWLPKIFLLSKRNGWGDFLRSILVYVILFGVMFFSLNAPLIQVVAYFSIAVVMKWVFTKTKHSKLDRWFGDLSYPLYILHIPISILVRWLGFYAVTPLSCFLSVMFGTIVVVYAIERPINTLRTRLRKRQEFKKQNLAIPAEAHYCSGKA